MQTRRPVPRAVPPVERPFALGRRDRTFGRLIGRRGLFARAGGVVLMLLTLLAQVEVLVADVHDGDAVHRDHAASVRGDTSAHVAASTAAHRGAASTAAGPDGPHDRPEDGGSRSHGLHICHCTHAHVAFSAPAPPPLGTAADRAERPDDRGWRPTSHLAPPPTHPPAA